MHTNAIIISSCGVLQMDIIIALVSLYRIDPSGLIEGYRLLVDIRMLMYHRRSTL